MKKYQTNCCEIVQHEASRFLLLLFLPRPNVVTVRHSQRCPSCAGLVCLTLLMLLFLDSLLYFDYHYFTIVWTETHSEGITVCLRHV